MSKLGKRTIRRCDCELWILSSMATQETN